MRDFSFGELRARSAQWDLKGGAMFFQQKKPRAGVAKIPSDGEELFVTKPHRPLPQQVKMFLAKPEVAPTLTPKLQQRILAVETLIMEM